jgi:hypothetical protein
VGVAFLLTTLVIVVTPGPGVLYTVAAAITRGRRASLIAALGCTLGIIPHLVAAITGLAALLYASSLAFQTLKYVGVAYLFFLAWKAYHDDSRIVIGEVAEIETPVPVWSVILKAVLINLLNPKLTIFFFAFLPPVRPHRSAQRCAPHAGPRLGFHVGDLDGLCRLWRVRGSSPSARTRSTTNHDLDAAHLRRLLRGACGAVGCLRAMT